MDDPDTSDETGAPLCQSVRPWQRTSRTAFADLPPEPDDPLLGFAPYLHKQRQPTTRRILPMKLSANLP